METAEEIIEKIKNALNAVKGQQFIKLPIWEMFASHLAYDNRFGSSPLKEDVCKFIDVILKNQNLMYNITKGTTIFRARKISVNQITKNEDGTHSGFDEKRSGIPPIRETPNGRVNTAGIPILYTTTERDTACAEIRPMKNDYISLAEYEMNETITVADFTLEQAEKHCNSIEGKFFLRKMFSSFSMPISNDLIDYLPTQFIAEYIKLNHKDISGIRYSSLHNIEGYNVAIFDSSKCKFIRSYILECNRVTYEYVENPLD